jgi:hypothetical protein
MTLEEYTEYIKLQLTGWVLESELDDATIQKIILASFQEVQRYIDETKMITVPFAQCIDLTDFKASAIVNVYRTEGYMGDASSGGFTDGSAVDPMQAQMWMAFSNGGTMYNLNSYIMNYLSYNTLLQMRNTTSTDMAFKEDKHAKKLYINTSSKPTQITIEYVPIFQTVDEITSDYWIDILKRLSLASTKIILGRIRTRFVQTNALWTDDGETILAEGNKELDELRETLRTNSVLFYPID